MNLTHISVDPLTLRTWRATAPSSATMHAALAFGPHRTRAEDHPRVVMAACPVTAALTLHWRAGSSASSMVILNFADPVRPGGRER